MRIFLFFLPSLKEKSQVKNENAEQIPGEQINSYQASSYDGGPYLALHAFAKQVQIYRVSGNFDGTVHNLTAGRVFTAALWDVRVASTRVLGV